MTWEADAFGSPRMGIYNATSTVIRSQETGSWSESPRSTVAAPRKFWLKGEMDG